MFLASTLGVVAATVIAFLALTLILVALLLFTIGVVIIGFCILLNNI